MTQIPTGRTMQKPDVICTNGVTVATFGPDQNDLGTSAISELKGIQKVVEQSDPPRMVIDLKSVANMDAALLSFLVELNQRLRFQIDGKLGICNIPEQVRRDLTVMNGDSSFDLFETCEAAIAALSVNK